MEFALILPIFLILVVGMVETSVLLYNKMVITNASMAGARYGVVIRDGGYADLSDVEEFAVLYCANNLMNFSGSSSVKAVAESSSEEQESPTLGDTLSVRVDYQYTGLIFMNHSGQLFNLSSTAVMPYE